jgi:hypothetical protein
MSDLPSNTTSKEQRLQFLLAEQAEIQAEIDALHASPTSFQHQRSPVHKQFQPRQRDVPRSVPSSAAAMARHLSSVGHILWSLNLAPL